VSVVVIVGIRGVWGVWGLSWILRLMSICVKASASASACCIFATATTTSALVLVVMHHGLGTVVAYLKSVMERPCQRIGGLGQVFCGVCSLIGEYGFSEVSRRCCLLQQKLDLKLSLMSALQARVRPPGVASRSASRPLYLHVSRPLPLTPTTCT
jgi:hypothetical protein